MFKKRFILILLAIAIPINLAYSELIINEVMYNPGKLNTTEFVEVKGTNNLTNFSISDDVKNVSLTLVRYVDDSNFSLIAQDNFNYTDMNCSIYLVSTIGAGLNNDGDNIYLYYNNTLIDKISYDGKKSDGNNRSLERVDDVWVESLEIGGTPGRENTGVVINDSEIVNTTNSTPDMKMDIDINISSANLSLNDTLVIMVDIKTTFNESKDTNLSIKIARNVNGSWKYRWYIIEDAQMIISNNTFLNFSWTAPDDLIIGDYKVLATLDYDDTLTSAGKEFYVHGLEDLGEYELIIVDAPESMGFGDIEKIVIRFDSNNYRIRNASFAAYIYEPRWASIDLDDNTLLSRPYDKDVALKFDEISRGTTSYISLPLLSKRNCDGDYSSGTYKAKVRFYENDDDLLEETFNITLSGKNPAMCPESEVKQKTNSASGNTQMIPSGNVDLKKNDSFTYDETIFTIVSPDIISEDFYINITMTNPANDTKYFDTWSYLLDGRKALSDKSDNMQNIEVKSKEVKEIRLKNLLDKSIDSGTYKLMIKINSTNRKSEKSISKEISVSRKGSSPRILSFYTRNVRFDEKINLYASCSNDEGKVILESQKDSKMMDCNGTVKFEVDILKGNNLFFLSLIQDNDTLDMRKLLIFANETSIISYDDAIEIYDRMRLAPKTPEVLSSNILTGSVIQNNGVIYESSNEKVKKLIKYLIPTIFVIAAMLFMGRKYG